MNAVSGQPELSPDLTDQEAEELARLLCEDAMERAAPTMAKIAAYSIRVELEARGFRREFINEVLEGVAQRSERIFRDPAERARFEAHR